MVKFHYRLKYGRILSVLLLIFLVVMPVVLFILPFDHFDHGQSMCASKLLFDVECYGCGMTRACMRLIHGRLYEAMDFNKLSLIVFPCLSYLWGLQLNMEIRFLLGRNPEPEKKESQKI
jgi:hypothetical protein